jgi:hypothetical protein
VGIEVKPPGVVLVAATLEPADIFLCIQLNVPDEELDMANISAVFRKQCYTVVLVPFFMREESVVLFVDRDVQN